MRRVRDVFERAYGPIPEGATCHVGYETRKDDSLVSPTWRTRAEGTHTVQGGDWAYAMSRYVIGGDISDQPAAAFAPVFQCAAYDAALDELTREEIAPGTVIALADAYLIAEDEAEEQGLAQAVKARERFQKASRRYWSEQSADGTGESPAFSKHNGLDKTEGGG